MCRAAIIASNALGREAAANQLLGTEFEIVAAARPNCEPLVAVERGLA